MSIRFDGDDYIYGGDYFYSDELTLVASVMPEVVDGETRTILLKRNSANSASLVFEWALGSSKNGVSFQAMDINQNIAVEVHAPALKVNVRTHIGVTVPKNGSGLPSLYYNGTLVTKGIRNNVVVNTESAIQIGAHSNNRDKRYFKGEIGKVAIWNKALSPLQMKSIADPLHDVVTNNNFDNLLFYLPMNEGIKGNSAHDEILIDKSKFNRKFKGFAGGGEGLIWMTP